MPAKSSVKSKPARGCWQLLALSGGPLLLAVLGSLILFSAGQGRGAEPQEGRPPHGGGGPPAWDGTAYVAMGPGKAVAVVDLVAGHVLARLPLSVESHGVEVIQGGRRIVAADLTKGDAMEIVDAPTGAPAGRLVVGKGAHHLKLSPDGRWLYVTRSEAGRVTVVDVQAMRAVADIATGAGANYAVFSPDSKTAYVSNTEGNDIAVIDVATSRVIRRIPVKEGPGHLALSPDGGRLYVANERSGTLGMLDPARDVVLGTVSTGDEPHGLAVSLDGMRAYLSSHEEGTVSAVETGTMTGVRMAVARKVKVGAGPEHVEIAPDGRWLVVARPSAGELVVLDAKSLATVRKIAVGKEPHQMAFAPGR